MLRKQHSAFSTLKAWVEMHELIPKNKLQASNAAKVEINFARNDRG